MVSPNYPGFSASLAKHYLALTQQEGVQYKEVW